MNPKNNALISFGLLAVLTPATALLAQTAPPTPPDITPPPGNVAYLTAHAVGTQNYICLPTPTGALPATAWTFLGPQATLSVTFGHFTQQVLTHFLSTVPGKTSTADPACTLSADGMHMYCPSWQSSFDSSRVWGSKVGSIDAGTDPSCPNTGAVACLLLKAVANRPGHFGNGLLARATYVQRLNTTGGSTPTGACAVGALELVPYSADYTFFAAQGSNQDTSVPSENR